jgi:hypothetical protein
MAKLKGYFTYDWKYTLITEENEIEEHKNNKDKLWVYYKKWEMRSLNIDFSLRTKVNIILKVNPPIKLKIYTPLFPDGLLLERIRIPSYDKRLANEIILELIIKFNL